MYAKMITPLVPARVEKHYKLIGQGINPREVRPFSQVATMAGQRKIAKFCGATMLFGNDVFDVVGKMAVLLLEQAILAPIPRPLADQIPHLGVCHGWEFGVSLRWALSLRIAMKSAALIRAS